MDEFRMKSRYGKLYQYFPDGRPRPGHYFLAIACVILAALLREFINPLIGGGFAFILFYPAVVFVAWLGGLGPGLLATALSAVTALLFFIEPRWSLETADVQAAVQLVIFIISGVGISVLLDTMHHIVEEERRLSAEIHNQHEWFRVTLSSIGDAVMVTNRDGILNFVNGEAERLTGWTTTEAKGKPLRAVFRIINEETRKPVDDPVEKVFKEKRIVGLANHTLLLAKDGTERPIDDSAAPIYDQNGVILGVVLVFHDASEARRAQSALKAHADDLEHKVFERTLTLQRTITELEAFSYSVSHDLRSPLRAMLGYSTALLEDYSQILPAEGKDYLQRIERAAKRLDRLIQDLLTYSRLTTEQTSIAPIDFDRLVRDVILQYPDLQAHSADITIEGKLPWVLGHEAALTQVVVNLIGNAVKFVRPNEQPRVTVRAEISEHVARIWFCDQGIGIEPENYARIFKMFEQVNPSDVYGGTGIGLAVVKKAIEKMQGIIGVESRAGEGSRFWIELLLAKNS